MNTTLRRYRQFSTSSMFRLRHVMPRIALKRTFVLCAPLLSAILLASPANAATMYVSPSGTATAGCDRAAPCDLTSAAKAVVAGDTVILMDGVYKATPLLVTASGTASSWITFQADECATPIIEGTGVGPTDDNQDTGVGSIAGLTTGQYIRYIGLVSRGWNTGFGNHWVDTDNGESAPSNGNVEYAYCVGDGNGRTGFTHYSASGIHIKNCISSHNGSSTAHSWSSGVTLYATSKGSGTALVEGTLSFENMDAEKNTDGSGFIVDEEAHNATFVNNIAFRNGGGCFRLTRSSGTKFINNTCFHNAQDLKAQGPDNPGEVYFTTNGDTMTTTGVSFLNNVFVATGTGPGKDAVYNQPTSGWATNTVATGTVAYFTSPEGTNPDFTLATGSVLAGKGSTGSGVPATDIGFDVKCITKKPPIMVGNIALASWWQYSVDIDYIKRIGGVAKCFNPKTRAGKADIGAYSNGAVTTSSGTCHSSAGGTTSTGGATGTGGTGNGGTGNGGTGNGGTGSGVPSLGGTTSVGGTSASSLNAGGKSTDIGGTTSVGGVTSYSAGGSNATSSGGTKPSSSTGGASSSVVTVSSGGSSTIVTAPTSGGSSSIGGSQTSLIAPTTIDQPNSGCGCRVEQRPSRPNPFAGFSLLGSALLGLRRRSRKRSILNATKPPQPLHC